MEFPGTKPPLPADYYRRHASRVRQLASDATTPAIKEHLRDVAAEYDRLAERVDAHGGEPSPVVGNSSA